MTVNLGSVVALITLVGSIVLTLGRSLWLVAEVKSDLDKIEKELLQHVQSTSLHRNADSEARWERLESKIDKLEEQLAKVLQAIANNGGKGNA